jgi:Holliday junction resolvase-like predicted endonuclease
MTTIEKILDSKGPMMSSKIVEILESKEKISKNTASQKVSRDNSIIKIKGFYTSGQSFCYLEKHISDISFFDILLKSMEENGKKYWYCINAIRMNGGIISQKYLECYTNYPIIPLKSHLPFKIVMQNFVSSGILIFDNEHYLIAPKFNQSYNNYTQYKTIETIKDDILNNFHSYVKNIGLISYNTGNKFSEFGKFKWCFSGVCPINGLKTNNKFGFLIADILFGHSIYEKDVTFFIEKIKTIQSFQNASKILPFLIVDDIDPKALELLKKNGIVIGFIKELFGEKYAETLKNLVNVLNNAGASLKNDPNKYLDLIAELKKYNEGLANNIKGTLFEFVIGHIHSVDSNNSIDLGREIFENKGRHEIDVLAVYNDKIVFAECKATNSSTSSEKIEKWKSQKIPAFRKWAEKQETWKNKKLEFEYWSTNGYDREAESILKSISESAKKFKISYFSGPDIRERTLQMKDKKLKEAVDNFFLKTKL